MIINNKDDLFVIYNKHITDLYSYGRKFTKDSELVKDCIHDVFITMYEKENIAAIHDLKYYLFRAIRNKLIDALSKKPLEDIDEAKFIFIPDNSSGDSLDDKESDQQTHISVNKAFGKLTKRQQEAVSLYYIDEMSYEEISRMMNMNYQSVRNIIHRALTKIRRESIFHKSVSKLFF